MNDFAAPAAAGDSRTIHERMVAILAELPAIGKDQKNTQQGFMFRGHDQILNALNPLLAKHGVFVVPDVIERVTSQRQTSKGSVMFEVNLHVRYTFLGAAGDQVSASTWSEGTDMGDKATSKAMTMAFKTILNQTFAISSEEFQDSDGDQPGFVAESAGYAATPEAETPRSEGGPPRAGADGGPPSNSEGQDDRKRLMAKLHVELKALEDAYPVAEDQGLLSWKGQMRERFKVTSAAQLSNAQLADAIAWITSTRKNEGIPF